MPRPTSRGYALLALAAGTYAAARVVGTWELYLFAFAFLAVVVVAWLFVFITGQRIKVVRSMGRVRPMAGDRPEISLMVKNDSLLPGPRMTLRNRVVEMTSQDLETEVESLAPRGQTLITDRFGRVSRGIHVLPPAESRAEDPLGAVRASHRVSAPLTVTVYPRIEELDSCVLYPDTTLRHTWDSQHGPLMPGAAEFKGIRPHQPGEPLSHIDWKATAKTGVLMRREMEDPAGTEVTLLLDGTSTAVVGDLPDTNFEMAVQAAAGIADFALRADKSVNLLRHEQSWQQTRLTADGAGRRSLLEHLAQARPNAATPFVQALQHLHGNGNDHLLRAQNVTLVSMSLDQQLVRALITLRESGARLSFVYVSGRSFAHLADEPGTLLPFLPARDTEPDDEEDLEATGEQDERKTKHDAKAGISTQARALLLALASAGIPCLTLEYGDDLRTALSAVAGARPRDTSPLRTAL